MAQEQALKSYKQQFQSNKESYFTSKSKAEKEYNQMKGYGMIEEKMPFQQWALSNYPELQIKESGLWQSQAQLLQVGDRLYGPRVKEYLPDSEYALITSEQAKAGMVGIQL